MSTKIDCHERYTYITLYLYVNPS